MTSARWSRATEPASESSCRLRAFSTRSRSFPIASRRAGRATGEHCIGFPTPGRRRESLDFPPNRFSRPSSYFDASTRHAVDRTEDTHGLGRGCPRRPSPAGIQTERRPVERTSIEGSTAYRNGLCVDSSTRPYSPGRPRCEQCHRDHLDTAGPASIKDEGRLQAVCSSRIC